MIFIDVLRSLRPQQWIKNLFVFAALIFSQNITDLALLWRTLFTFAVFCILSGALYVFNDMRDLEEDRLHPEKSKRPIASGRIKKSSAVIIFLFLSVLALLGASAMNTGVLIVALLYFILQIAYSTVLKHVVILDVFIIAAGFFIRVVAGGLAIEVDLSPWLLICTILLALFLAMSKRRHELVLLEESAEDHRPILKEYSPYLLDQMIAVVTASTVVAYCLYTISSETVAKFQSSYLIFTVPFVLYGIFRYLYLVHQKRKGGSPESLIIKDLPLLVDLFLWIASVVLILYIKW
jgi:4-hydroxybenzoate polyprenyltransferase